ncbi:MAG: NAD(P)-dependent oxidoreductase, partial [Actinomycetota bacterium]|nr:NAD(P)-dependent oxidoreductase [Actinomycetota bacterium]
MTVRIAIVGANGRVGAELCLRLGSREDIEVIPIVRNRTGSAFLRISGMECRHGRVENPDEARRLLADCDLVLNLAYAFPRSRAGHRANVATVTNVVEAAPAGALVALASTIMVYAPNLRVRAPGAYGLEKLLLERVFLRTASRCKRLPFILRIGHVLGDLQPLSAQILCDIRLSPIVLPDGGERPSNTVFAATLAEATELIAGGTVCANTYDLVTDPQWTWRRVYNFHGANAGLSMEVNTLPPPGGITSAVKHIASGSLSLLARPE